MPSPPDVVRVAVLSDTHAPRFWKTCPPAVARLLDGADLVLHAGDVCVPSVLDELTAFAPVHAVLGNNDGAGVAAWGPGVPEELRLTVAGVRIAMLHDSGPASGRLPRLRARFPGTDLVVFGHSHIPWNEESGGFRVFNPGSPTDKRRQPHGTVGLLELAGGRVESAMIVAVTP